LHNFKAIILPPMDIIKDGIPKLKYKSLYVSKNDCISIVETRKVEVLGFKLWFNNDLRMLNI